MPEPELARRRARVAAEAADRRARRVAGARRQGRASTAAKGDASTVEPLNEPVDEGLLEIVAAGDTSEPAEIEAAVEQALAEDGDDAGEAEEAESDSATTDEDESAGGHDVADDEETSD